MQKGTTSNGSQMASIENTKKTYGSFLMEEIKFRTQGLENMIFDSSSYMQYFNFVNVITNSLRVLRQN